jgi:hypothetical protein
MIIDRWNPTLQGAIQKVRVACCALSVAALTASWNGSAGAQAVSSCGLDAATRATLESAKTASEDARVSIARALIDNWHASLPALMDAIQNMKESEASTWTAAERQYAIFLTGVVKTILASKNLSIPFFRQCDNDKTVKPLLWAARGDNTDLRLNTANILANTVDNTNVCFVLHHLRDKNLSDNGRANLLGIARAVASYAYRENVEAISQTIEIVKQNLGNKLDGLPQTRLLLDDLQARAQKSSNGGAALPASLSRYCNKNYPYDAALTR